MRKIFNGIVALIVAANIVLFGFVAWPTGIGVTGAIGGMPLVAAVAKDSIVRGGIYELDQDTTQVQAILRLDEQLYSTRHEHLVTIKPGWKSYIITGELARKISHKTGAFAFTDPLHRIVIFLAINGTNPMLIISHEFTHVLQAEDSFRIMFLTKTEAEYEAEVTSRFVTTLLSGLPMPTYPIHGISKFEKLQVRKYLASLGL